MRVLGLTGGAAIVIVGSAFNQWAIPLVVIGAIELCLAAATFRFVREGPAGRPREGRPWRSIALEAWGTDVLRERSFLFMTATRLLFLMGTGIFVNVSVYYMEDSLGQADPDWRAVWLFAGLAAIVAGNVVGTFPAARFSDRIGRKPVIWAAAGLAAAGIGVVAVAPVPIVAIPGVFLLGIGSGAYLSVDWALMTEVIPRATTGRYMGLGNIANSISGPIGLVFGGLLIDSFTRGGLPDVGPRVAVALGIVFLAGAAIALIGVHPRIDPRRPVTVAAAA